MDTVKYQKTEDWKRNKQEVHLEIAAVILPLFLYFISLVIIQFAPAQPHHRDLWYILIIPDGFFGGCIMFSFTIIQIVQINNDLLKESTIEAKFNNIILLSYSGFIICIILSFVSIIFQPLWSFPVGIITIYLGSLSYKKIVFYRSYLKYGVSTRIDNCNT